MSVKIQIDKNRGAKLSVSCGNCKIKTNHAILTEASFDGTIEHHDDDFLQWHDEFQVVQCLGCDYVSFRHTHKNSDNYRLVNGDWKEITQIEQYPNPEAGRLPIDYIEIAPQDLQHIYSETIRALNHGLQVLTGIGIRAIIETVCKEKQANGYNLKDKIDDLVSQGVLNSDGASILHQVRTLGNKAAHEVKPHDNVQLGVAMDVVDHLLKGVYILPHHAAKSLK